MYSKDFTEYLRVLHGILGGSSTEYLICYEDRGGGARVLHGIFGIWILDLDFIFCEIFFKRFSGKKS
jgi:succinate dehydrogenase/fumarate reductase cytochrome b subunit